MELDDLIFNDDVLGRVKNALRSIVTISSAEGELTEQNIELWENEKCYCGYSVAYHTLYPIVWVVFQRLFTNEDEVDLKKVRQAVRAEVLSLYNNEEDESDN